VTNWSRKPHTWSWCVRVVEAQVTRDIRTMCCVCLIIEDIELGQLLNADQCLYLYSIVLVYMRGLLKLEYIEYRVSSIESTCSKTANSKLEIRVTQLVQASRDIPSAIPKLLIWVRLSIGTVGNDVRPNQKRTVQPSSWTLNQLHSFYFQTHACKTTIQPKMWNGMICYTLDNVFELLLLFSKRT